VQDLSEQHHDAEEPQRTGRSAPPLWYSTHAGCATLPWAE
jgi:hypothetical protein